MRVTFQIVLKTPIYPQHYLATKLYAVVQAESSAIGDFDFETISEWISVTYYTAYKEVASRYLLGCAIDIPPDVNEIIARRIIEGDADDATLDSFGSVLQSDTETVEAVLRYEDEALVADINKYHPEIFDLEMKLREVINYILCYNLQHHNVFDFICEFKDISIKSYKTNELIKDYKKRKRKDKTLQHPLSRYFENELFHLVVRDYKGFTKPQKRDLRSLKAKISDCKNLDELRDWLRQAFDFSKLNPEHRTFIGNVETRIIPIENLRNDIMHNRRIPPDTISDFERAKGLMLAWINEFWKQEAARPKMDSLRQAEYIMKTLLESSDFENGSTITYTDLDNEVQEADDLEELKAQFFDIINDKLTVDDQDTLADLVSDETDKAAALRGYSGG